MSAKTRSLGFAGHAANYAIGNVVSRLVGFLMLPIYTRYLTPADYGAVGLLIFALAVLEPFFGARLGGAVPKFYTDAPEGRQRAAVIWGAFAATGSVSAVTAVAIFLFRDPASQALFGSHEYALATGLFGINMLARPIEATGMMYLRVRERSGLYLGVSMAKLTLQIALNLLLVVYWQLGVLGIVLSGVISSSCLSIGLTLYIAALSRPVFDWDTTRRMVRFCLPLWFSGIAGLYVGSSGAVYLRVLDSLSAVGLLELGLRFATAVSLLVWTPFYQHWEPLSFRYYKEAGGRKNFQVAFIAMSALLLIAGMGVSVFSRQVIHIMAAQPFHAAARIVPLLTLGLVLNSLSSFFSFAFLATERTRLYSISEYLTGIALTIGYVTLIPRFGVEGAAIGQCLALGFKFGLLYFWCRRYYDAGFALAPVSAFVLIAALAYSGSNLLLQASGFVTRLAVESIVVICASILITVIGLKAIKNASQAHFDAIGGALRRLHRSGA